jgi:hypothetical protein
MMPTTTPPTAKRVIAVDFDDTIAPWGPLFDLDPPFPGVAEALQRAHRAGYKIVVLTSRLSRRWWQEDCTEFGFANADVFGFENWKYVKNYLDYWKIPYFEITAEKVPAEIYLDDKGYHVPPGMLGCMLDAHIGRQG